MAQENTRGHLQESLEKHFLSLSKTFEFSYNNLDSQYHFYIEVMNLTILVHIKSGMLLPIYQPNIFTHRRDSD